jgi:hypothetical protein
MRMANEIDQGQLKGEVATPGGNKTIPRSAGNATYEELGVPSQRVSEWRKLRDAGPEKVEKAISTALKEGRTPTKRDIRCFANPEFQAEAEALRAKSRL